MRYREARDPADAYARFVWVDDTGWIREVTPDECAYLASAFKATDAGRPYVKESYRSLTPDGRMRGFLELSQLPDELHHRVRRGGGPAPPRAEPFLDTRAIRQTLVTIVVTCVVTYLAVLAGAFVALQFMRPGYRGLGMALLVAAAFASLPYYLIFGPVTLLLTADPERFLRFMCVTALYLGLLAGAAWVLWLHGNPSRILLYR